MNILWMLLIGSVVGAVAGRLVSGRPGGIMMTVLLGVCGAVLTGYLGRALDWFRAPVTGSGIMVSVLGATGVIVVFGLIASRRVRESRHP
jgi:uncharacterized membrane protein YeaQ/YmgE (transglycosylase-associated protein family)